MAFEALTTPFCRSTHPAGLKGYGIDPSKLPEKGIMLHYLRITFPLPLSASQESDRGSILAEPF